jgi:hypothetical protein
MHYRAHWGFRASAARRTADPAGAKYRLALLDGFHLCRRILHGAGFFAWYSGLYLGAPRSQDEPSVKREILKGTERSSIISFAAGLSSARTFPQSDLCPLRVLRLESS